MLVDRLTGSTALGPGTPIVSMAAENLTKNGGTKYLELATRGLDT